MSTSTDHESARAEAVETAIQVRAELREGLFDFEGLSDGELAELFRSLAGELNEAAMRLQIGAPITTRQRLQESGRCCL